MTIIRTMYVHGKIPSEDTLFDSRGEDGQLSAWHQMIVRAGYLPILLWPTIEWPALEMHSIVISPGLAKSLSRVLDLWDNLRLTYTLITTNSENRVEQHLTIYHQPGHGYHIYLISIDCLKYLPWLLDLTRTYFNNKEQRHYCLRYLTISLHIWNPNSSFERENGNIITKSITQSLRFHTTTHFATSPKYWSTCWILLF